MTTRTFWSFEELDRVLCSFESSSRNLFPLRPFLCKIAKLKSCYSPVLHFRKTNCARENSKIKEHELSALSVEGPTSFVYITKYFSKHSMKYFVLL